MPVVKPKVAAPLTLGFSMNDDPAAGEDAAAEKAEAAEDPKGVLLTFAYIPVRPGLTLLDRSCCCQEGCTNDSQQEGASSHFSYDDTHIQASAERDQQIDRQQHQ